MKFISTHCDLDLIIVGKTGDYLITRYYMITFANSYNFKINWKLVWVNQIVIFLDWENDSH